MIWDGFKIWDDLRSGCGCEICGCGWVSLALLSILVVVVYVVVFFFFFVVVADIGGRWLICGGGRGCGLWRLICGCGLLLLLLMMIGRN